MNPPVLFLSGTGSLAAAGSLRCAAVPVGEVADRVHAWLADEVLGHAGVAMAALPFDTRRDACLVVPERWSRQAPDAGAASWIPRPARAVTAQPTREGYVAAVDAALERIGRAAPGGKIVLSRRLTLDFDAPIDLAALVERLAADTHATTFCVPLDADTPARVLVGATPELLVAKTGAAVTSSPLAGSTRRRPDLAGDRAAAAQLTRSEKDRREHRVVVEWIADRLAPHCRELTVPPEPGLVCTAAMWHLASEIHGVLRDPSTPSAQLAVDLHPTPAVGGAPPDMALAAIDDLEPFDRRFYGGVVGWSDGGGDGRWMVAIRCAEIEGVTAQVCAGAGIVAGSIPEAEADETSAKLTTLLSALGIDETGRVLSGLAR